MLFGCIFQHKTPSALRIHTHKKCKMRKDTHHKVPDFKFFCCPQQHRTFYEFGYFCFSSCPDMIQTSSTSHVTEWNVE